MKQKVYGGLLILSLLGVFAAMGWLEAEAITCGQAVLIGGVSIAGMVFSAHMGGYMGPYYPMKKKKSPARRQPCKARGCDKKSPKSSTYQVYR